MWTLWTGSCSFPEQRNRTKNHSLVSVRKKNSFRKSSQPTAAHPWVYNRLNYLRQVSSFTPSNEAHLVVTLSACNCKSSCGRQWSVAGSSGLQQMKDSIGGRSFPWESFHCPICIVMPCRRRQRATLLILLTPDDTGSRGMFSYGGTIGETEDRLR